MFLSGGTILKYNTIHVVFELIFIQEATSELCKKKVKSVSLNFSDKNFYHRKSFSLFLM